MHFWSLKLNLFLQIDINDIINCNTFSVAPSLINGKFKKCAVLFDSNGGSLLSRLAFKPYPKTLDQEY